MKISENIRGAVTPFVDGSRALRFPIRSALAILALQFGMILFEGVTVAGMVPVLQYAQSAGDITKLAQESRFWERLVQIQEITGWEIGLGTLIIGLSVSILLRQLFRYAQTVYKTSVTLRTLANARNHVFQRYLSADLTRLDDLRMASLVNLIATETDRAVNCLMHVVRWFGSASLIIFYVGMLMVIAPLMTAYFIGALVIEGLALMQIVRKVKSSGYRITKSNKQITNFLLGRLGALSLIKLSGTEKQELEELKKLTSAQRKVWLDQTKLVSGANALIEPAFSITCLAFLFASIAIIQMPLEFTIIYFGIMLRLVPGVVETFSDFQGAISKLGSLQNYSRLLKRISNAGSQAHGHLPFSGITREIEFDNVSYNYSGQEAVLHDVSLRVPAGKILALVGPSGSGKTTLIDMLPRLRDPSKGVVRVDGTSLDQFDLSSLRAGIAFVPQDPVLLAPTPALHITYGQDEKDIQNMEQAARLAGAYDFIANLSDKFDTYLGENGTKLSVGQRQRLDIARALYRKARLLVLDEPASALDPHAEDSLRNVLRNICDKSGATIIVVAHGMSTAAMCDAIVVLREGRVLGQGDHTQMVNSIDWYRHAVAAQTDFSRTADESRPRSEALQMEKIDE